jgi:succinate dehydrogenase/fumarate reductase flavoprotein subunit
LVLKEARKLEQNRLQELLDRSSRIPFTSIRDELRRVMTEQLGIYRDKRGLRTAVDAIQRLRRKHADVVIRDIY